MFHQEGNSDQSQINIIYTRSQQQRSLGTCLIWIVVVVYIVGNICCMLQFPVDNQHSRKAWRSQHCNLRWRRGNESRETTWMCFASIVIRICMHIFVALYAFDRIRNRIRHTFPDFWSGFSWEVVRFGVCVFLEIYLSIG